MAFGGDFISVEIEINDRKHQIEETRFDCSVVPKALWQRRKAQETRSYIEVP
jgi:adenylate cyclase class IV